MSDESDGRSLIVVSRGREPRVVDSLERTASRDTDRSSVTSASGVSGMTGMSTMVAMGERVASTDSETVEASGRGEDDETQSVNSLSLPDAGKPKRRRRRSIVKAPSLNSLRFQVEQRQLRDKQKECEEEEAAVVVAKNPADDPYLESAQRGSSSSYTHSSEATHALNNQKSSLFAMDHTKSLINMTNQKLTRGFKRLENPELEDKYQRSAYPEHFVEEEQHTKGGRKSTHRSGIDKMTPRTLRWMVLAIFFLYLMAEGREAIFKTEQLENRLWVLCAVGGAFLSLIGITFYKGLTRKVYNDVLMVTITCVNVTLVVLEVQFDEPNLYSEEQFLLFAMGFHLSPLSIQQASVVTMICMTHSFVHKLILRQFIPTMVPIQGDGISMAAVGGLFILTMLCVSLYLSRRQMEKEKRYQWLIQEHGIQARQELYNHTSKSQMLLKSMLPGHIVRKLMLDSRNLRLAEAKKCCGILFLDLVGFTRMSSDLSAQEVVDLLNDLFSDFDEVVEKYRTCDKIKNIGDAMMVGAGVFEDVPEDKAAAQLCACAIELLNACTVFNLSSEKPIQVRIGIHFGPLVGGVIASLAYDVWGETVTIAAALESQGEPGKIRVSEATYELVKDHFNFEEGGILNFDAGEAGIKTRFIKSMKTPVKQIIHNWSSHRTSPALGRLGKAANKLSAVIRVKQSLGSQSDSQSSTDFVKNLQQMMASQSQSSFASGLDSMAGSSLGSAPAAFFQSVTNVKDFKDDPGNNHRFQDIKLNLLSLKFDAEINREDAKQELKFKRRWGHVPDDVPLWDRPELGGKWRTQWLADEVDKYQRHVTEHTKSMMEIKSGKGSSAESELTATATDTSWYSSPQIARKSRLTTHQLSQSGKLGSKDDVEMGKLTVPRQGGGKEPTELVHLPSLESLKSEKSSGSRLERLDSLEIASSTDDVVIPPMRLEPVTVTVSHPKESGKTTEVRPAKMPPRMMRRGSTDASLFEHYETASYTGFSSPGMSRSASRDKLDITLPNIEQRFEYYRSGNQRGKLIRYCSFSVFLLLIVEALDFVLVQEVKFDVNVSRVIRYGVMVPVMLVNLAIVKLPFSKFHGCWTGVTIVCHVVISAGFVAIGIITTQARYVTANYLVTMMVAVFSGLGFVRGSLTAMGINLGTVLACVIWGYRFPAGQQWDWYFANAISILGLSVFVAYNHERRQRVVFFHNGQLQRQQMVLSTSHDDYQRLLLTIFPNSVAERLQLREEAFGENIDSVCVLFADMSGFTDLVRKLPPDDLINVLNAVFTTFDALIQKHFMRKVKTIGDSIMVVAGAPKNSNHLTPAKQAEVNARKAAKLSLRMHQEFKKLVKEMRLDGLELTVGINIGPVVAGAIGTHKFFWDVWGDTVNVASRLKSLCPPGKTQVSESVRTLLESRYHLEDRGEIQVKGKGKMHTHFLMHPKTHCEDIGC